MKEEKRILNAIGQADEKFIEEAAPVKSANKKTGWIKWAAAAACLALALAVGSMTGLFGNRADVAVLDNGDKISFVKSDSAGSALSLDMDVFTRELTQEEVKALFAGIPVSAQAVFSGSTGQLLGFTGKTGNVSLTVSTTNVGLRDTIIVGSEQSEQVSGVSVTAGYFLTDANSKGVKTAIYYASFDLGGSKVYVENAGTESQSEEVKNELATVIQKLIETGEFDLSAFEAAE